MTFIGAFQPNHGSSGLLFVGYECQWKPTGGLFQPQSIMGLGLYYLPLEVRCYVTFAYTGSLAITSLPSSVVFVGSFWIALLWDQHLSTKC